MNKKTKEPFFISHVISTALGVGVLGLIITVLIKDQGTAIYET